MKGKEMKKTFKRSLAGIAAIVITVTGAGLSGFGDNAYAATVFRDVSGSYWAKDEIAFAAEKGIVNGYASWDGTTYTFQPEKSVSYEEAATMLYRALSAAGKLQKTEKKYDSQGQEITLKEAYKDVLDAAGIADWARESVAYGLEEGIIGKDELSLFVNTETKLGNPATRIRVAVWTAKALNRDFAGVYYLPYTDASQIDDASAPYVDMLYRHGIMKGSLQLDGSIAFQPASAVKRSEFAAISNRVFNNAGLGFEESKEAFYYEIEGGSFAESDKLRLSDSALVSGSKSDCTAVSGISAAAGEKPCVYLVGDPKVQTGTIDSSEKLAGDLVKVVITSNKNNYVYLLDSETVNTAKIKNGTKVSFIADGVHLIEVK